jgi:hypothetical protein
MVWNFELRSNNFQVVAVYTNGHYLQKSSTKLKLNFHKPVYEDGYLKGNGIVSSSQNFLFMKCYNCVEQRDKVGTTNICQCFLQLTNIIIKVLSQVSVLTLFIWGRDITQFLSFNLQSSCIFLKICAVLSTKFFCNRSMKCHFNIK